MHWGGEINASHLFDIFCNFQPQRDSVKTRIEMISFVTSNYQRYSWDCDLFLHMNRLTLNDWVNKMTYWGNCRDTLAIYAMSDMYGVHSCVVTKSKPWTTVASTFQGTDIDVLKLCQVKLVYLGNHKYGKLVPKVYVGQSLYMTPNFNFTSMTQQPPLPPSLPNTQAPTLVQELETANTLLDLHDSKNTDPGQNESINTMNTAAPLHLLKKTDAMDKIVGNCERTDYATHALKVPDAMDSIILNESESDNLAGNVLNVEMVEQDTGTDLILGKQDTTLNVETKKLKACHVCIRPLENILFGEAKEDVPAPINDLPSGEHYTRSRTRKPVVRTGRMSRQASVGKQYEESNESPSPKKRRPISAKPQSSGPSEARISAQHNKSPYPSRRLPPISSNGDGEDDGTDDSKHDQLLPPPKTPSSNKSDTAPAQKKGTFTTKSHTLRKKIHEQEIHLSDVSSQE